MMRKIEEHPDPERRWKNRRRMAWMAMISGVLYPALFYLTDSPHLAAIAVPFYMFIGMVVSVYIGASTWETTKCNS